MAERVAQSDRRRETEGWDYRIRLKSNNIMHHQGWQITTGEATQAGLCSLEDTRFNEKDVATNIGILYGVFQNIYKTAITVRAHARTL